MTDKNCELLFEYLRSILYDEEIVTLDLEKLDEPFQKLGQGMCCLETMVREFKAYAADLSKGNLSVPFPPRDNTLCENLKNMHANLNHLTWQAKQVAKGDYSQQVSFLGEFSEAFNEMTKQLSERELSMKQEANQDPLTEIGNRRYFIQQGELLLQKGEQLIFCYCDLDNLKIINDRYGHSEGDAYILNFAANIKKQLGEEDIFARVGGDEFGIIFAGITYEQAEEKMKLVQKTFLEDVSLGYQKNFSYGIYQMEQNHRKLSVMELIELADSKMYQQKKAHKMSE